MLIIDVLAVAFYKKEKEGKAMFHVIETENVLIKDCMQAKKENRKFYIYGSGMAGQMACLVLQSLGIMVEGFCVDAQYCKPDMTCMGKRVIAFEEMRKIAKSEGKIAVLVAFMNVRKNIFESSEYLKIIEGDFCSLGVSPAILEEGRIDRKFVDIHTDSFCELYDMLEDETSKQCLNAYLNQKISGKLGYLEELYGKDQYYEKGLVHLENVACMVDCGAYDGDSYRAFCSSYESNTGKAYQGIAFLLEPDEQNFQTLQKQYGDQKNIILENMGAWDKKDTLWFQGDNTTASSFSPNGTVSMEVDSIDHIVSQQGGGQKVDFIKMDIEGSELHALQGAASIIKACHPILAVCVYHKKHDLLTIPQYIRKLYAGYRLYLRAYTRYSEELVLYAIPDGA